MSKDELKAKLHASVFLTGRIFCYFHNRHIFVKVGQGRIEHELWRSPETEHDSKSYAEEFGESNISKSLISNRGYFLVQTQPFRRKSWSNSPNWRYSCYGVSDF